MTENNHSRVERRKKIQEEQRSSKNQKPKKRFWKKFLYFSLIVGIVLFLIGVGAIILIIKDAPKFDETLLKNPLSSSLFASDGKTVIAEVGAEKRDDI